LSPLTAYSFSVKAKDAAGNVSASSTAVNVTTLATTITYCTSQGNSTADERIGKVVLGTISNTSTGTTGYENYTAITTNLTQGVANTITITPVWTSTTYNEAYAVFIDYNQDGEFSDSGETVWTKTASKTTPVSGSFTIPATASLGTTRVRISMKYYGIPTACESFSYGQVEDYTINIVAGSAVADQTLFADGSTIDQSAKVTIYPNPVVTSFSVSLAETKGSTFKIMNTLGQQLAAGTLTESPVDVSKLNSGIYFIEINNNGKRIVKKFVKK
jgi:bacillolysin